MLCCYNSINSQCVPHRSVYSILKYRQSPVHSHCTWCATNDVRTTYTYYVKRNCRATITSTPKLQLLPIDIARVTVCTSSTLLLLLLLLFREHRKIISIQMCKVYVCVSVHEMRRETNVHRTTYVVSPFFAS